MTLVSQVFCIHCACIVESPLSWDQIQTKIIARIEEEEGRIDHHVFTGNHDPQFHINKNQVDEEFEDEEEDQDDNSNNLVANSGMDVDIKEVPTSHFKSGTNGSQQKARKESES